jgi:hypothetical protein
MINTDMIYGIVAIVVPLVQLLGILTAVHAVINARTSQGAIAWAISLVTFPWLALVLYAIFGRNKFNGYVFSDKYIDFRQNLAEYRGAELILNQAILNQKNSSQLCCGLLHF